MKKLYLILLAILPMWIIAQNYCLDFDGSDDYVSVPDAAGLNVTDAITVEAWVKGEGEGFAADKRTTSAYTKYDPQFQVVGTKIYYVWHEYDGSKYQIWTAEMNTDGTNWSAAKRTSSGFDKYNPQLQVVGSKIYYVWHEKDGLSRYQIWTAEMNTDGTGWTATKRTTTIYNKYRPQLQVVGTKIYYVWYEYDGAKNQIWTAEMDTDGTDWSAAERTISVYNKYRPRLQVVGSKIYYVWYEMDGSGTHQIWTAEMNTNGTGLSGTKRTTTSPNKYNPQLQVTGIRFIMHGMKWTVLGIGKSGQQI